MSPVLEIGNSVLAIARNDDGRYEGDLAYYVRAAFNNLQNIRNSCYNFSRMCGLLRLCHQAIRFYSDGGLVLTRREGRNLLIAAIFCDFGHTERNVNDGVNITEALRAMRQRLLPEDAGERQAIEDIVRATEHPHDAPSEELPLASQIIRDADLIQSLDLIDFQHEAFKRAFKERKLPLDVLQAKEPFLCRLDFGTDWARHIFPRVAAQFRTAEMEDFIGFLTDSREPAAVTAS